MLILIMYCTLATGEVCDPPFIVNPKPMASAYDCGYIGMTVAIQMLKQFYPDKQFGFKCVPFGEDPDNVPTIWATPLPDFKPEVPGEDT